MADNAASIGGCFAEPADTFPSFFSPNGFFAKFPFVLPNIICAFLLVVAIVLGYLLLDETHPDKAPWVDRQDRRRRPSNVETPLLQTQGGNDHPPNSLTTDCYGTFDQVDTERHEIWRVKPNGEWIEDAHEQDDKSITRPVWLFVAALGIFTYHSMTYDHLLPIFLQDKRANDISAFESSTSSFAGGLGLSIQNVGLIMSINGIIALFMQAVVFPLLASWFGVWRLLVMVTIGHPIAYFIVPYLPLLPASMVYPGIYTCLTIRNLFSIIAYPLLLIMIKEAAPSAKHFGRINGLAASTGAACRSVASPIAGFLYGRSTLLHFTPLAWWASSLVALVGVMQIPWLAREAKNFKGAVHVSGRVGCTRKRSMSQSRVVRVMVEEDEDGTDISQLSEADTV
jgi:hypothetical protein